jgi:hypothetical protein
MEGMVLWRESWGVLEIVKEAGISHCMAFEMDWVV